MDDIITFLGASFAAGAAARTIWGIITSDVSAKDVKPVPKQIVPEEVTIPPLPNDKPRKQADFSSLPRFDDYNLSKLINKFPEDEYSLPKFVEDMKKAKEEEIIELTEDDIVDDEPLEVILDEEEPLEAILEPYKLHSEQEINFDLLEWKDEEVSNFWKDVVSPPHAPPPAPSLKVQGKQFEETQFLNKEAKPEDVLVPHHLQTRIRILPPASNQKLFSKGMWSPIGLPVSRYYYNVVEKKDNDGKVRVLSIPESVHYQIVKAFVENGDISDLETGRDLTFISDGAHYAPKIVLKVNNPSPAGTPEQVRQWLGDAFDLHKKAKTSLSPQQQQAVRPVNKEMMEQAQKAENPLFKEHYVPINPVPCPLPMRTVTQLNNFRIGDLVTVKNPVIENANSGDWSDFAQKVIPVMALHSKNFTKFGYTWSAKVGERLKVIDFVKNPKTGIMALVLSRTFEGGNIYCVMRPDNVQMAFRPDEKKADEHHFSVGDSVMFKDVGKVYSNVIRHNNCKWSNVTQEEKSLAHSNEWLKHNWWPKNGTKGTIVGFIYEFDRPVGPHGVAVVKVHNRWSDAAQKHLYHYVPIGLEGLEAIGKERSNEFREQMKVGDWVYWRTQAGSMSVRPSPIFETRMHDGEFQVKLGFFSGDKINRFWIGARKCSPTTMMNTWAKNAHIMPDEELANKLRDL